MKWRNFGKIWNFVILIYYFEIYKEIRLLLSYDCFFLGGGVFLFSIRMMLILIYDIIYIWFVFIIDLRRMLFVMCIFFLFNILIKK